MADAQKIRLQCPTCGKAVSVSSEYAGKRGRCPGCETVFTIPRADEPAAAEQAELDSRTIWRRAIEAAENGRQAEAVDAFRRAIGLDSSYSDSLFQPRDEQARACWNAALRANIRAKKAAKSAAADSRAKKTAKPAAAGPKPIRCACCGKDIGRDWHYQFESIALAQTVGAQCPDCGVVVCGDDLEYGPDGNYEPCARCGVELQMLSDGPAYSSMVEAARRERLYRGPIKEPAARSRPVTKG